jgi:hypothetical protein
MQYMVKYYFAHFSLSTFSLTYNSLELGSLFSTLAHTANSSLLIFRCLLKLANTKAASELSCDETNEEEEEGGFLSGSPYCVRLMSKAGSIPKMGLFKGNMSG